MNVVFVGDPMCSWCYGFGKELSALLSQEPGLSLHIVVGGLRAGGTEVLDAAGKQFRLAHWDRVEAASGLPFNRPALLERQGFVYDTEPICRAVVTARMIAPNAPLIDVFRALQRAFYVDGLDTTDASVLAEATAHALTAAGHACDAASVLSQFNLAATIAQTQDDFDKAKRWGVRSFPALMLEANGTMHSVVPGYASVAEIQVKLRPFKEAVHRAGIGLRGS